VKDGPEHLPDGGTPRIVAVPTRESYDAGEEYEATGPRAIAQRSSIVAFHLFGRKREDTEALIGELVNALRRVVVCAASLGTGTWERVDPDALTRYGRPYILEVTFAIPVVEQAVQEKIVTTVDVTDVSVET
jgi:hypothetical protein